jgi:hypothetical protein
LLHLKLPLQFVVKIKFEILMLGEIMLKLIRVHLKLMLLQFVLKSLLLHLLQFVFSRRLLSLNQLLALGRRVTLLLQLEELLYCL